MNNEVKRIKVEDLKTDKRFCQLSDYNRRLVLNEIENILVNNGGQIVINTLQSNITYKCYTNDTRQAMKEKIESLPMIQRINYSTSSGDRLRFILNGYFYEISYDSNPFFPITFSKIKIDQDGNYVGKRYVDSNESINDRSFKKNGSSAFSICYDNLFKLCSEAEINEMAKCHFEQINNVVINGAESSRYSERKRCRNYYSSSYHYEIVYDNTKCNVFAIQYSSCYGGIKV